MLDLLPSNIIYNIAKFNSIDDCKSLTVVNKKINRSIKHWFNIDDFSIIVNCDGYIERYYENYPNIKIRIYRYESGNIKSEEWFQNDKYYRSNNLPSIIEYYESGNIKSEEWFQNDKYHRDNNLPAIINYYESGNIKSEEWYQNNKLHRDNDLPTIIFYDENGNIIIKQWFQNGIFIKKSFE